MGHHDHLILTIAREPRNSGGWYATGETSLRFRRDGVDAVYCNLEMSERDSIGGNRNTKSSSRGSTPPEDLANGLHLFRN